MEYTQYYNRLLIFDGSHALHRNLSVDGNWDMQNSLGIRTGGVYGVLKTILKEVSLYNYYPIFVFDGGLSKRRLELYPNYKHTLDRQEKQLLTESIIELSPEEQMEREFKYEYENQREILKQLLPFFNIPVICYENWEGDDLIYLLTKLSKDSIVISDDRDLLQLIREDKTGRCRVKRAMRDEFWDLTKLQENYNNIDNFIINKAIVGDNSDNIPSACYGVGEKTAQDLFNFYQYLKENNITFPSTEEDLNKISKTHNLSKRKAFINFDENQFLINLMLTDLKLVDEDINKIEPKMLYNIIDNINMYFENTFNLDLQMENIKKILSYLDIRSFVPQELFNLVQDVKDVIGETTKKEIRSLQLGSLFQK